MYATIVLVTPPSRQDPIEIFRRKGWRRSDYSDHSRELEGGSRSGSHVFGIQPVRSVIRSTQADLLPVEGRPGLQLLFDTAPQTYDLETLLLL